MGCREEEDKAVLSPGGDDTADLSPGDSPWSDRAWSEDEDDDEASLSFEDSGEGSDADSDGLEDQAMRKAEAARNTNFPVKIKLVSPPLYVLTTQTLDKDQGISVLTDAIKACTTEIEKHKGKLVVKEAPRAVSEREDKLLNAQLDTLVEQNAEVAGDDDSEDGENKGMGDIDLANSGVHVD